MNIEKNLDRILKEIPQNVTLVAVTKHRSIEEIQRVVDYGIKDLGENRVQELLDKYDKIKGDIRWHLIGHLQTNKVKYIAPFVSLIHSVDSLKVLAEINKHALKNDRIIDCLLQIYIADEDTKFGLDHAEAIELLRSEEFGGFKNIRIRGLMGIASNTENEKIVKEEFYELKMLFDGIKTTYFRKEESFDILSMGMSSDYKVAIEQGSNMVRLGSTIFGKRIIKHYKAQ